MFSLVSRIVLLRHSLINASYARFCRGIGLLRRPRFGRSLGAGHDPCRDCRCPPCGRRDGRRDNRDPCRPYVRKILYVLYDLMFQVK